LAKERILVVDDEEGVRNSLQGILTDEGFHVDLADNGDAAIDAMRQESFQVVFLDVWMPGMDGLQVLETIGSMDTDPAVIMISGHGSIETAVRATKLGAFDFVEKPLSLDKIMLVARNALKQKNLEEKNRTLKELLRKDVTLIGDSPPVRLLREEIERAAPTHGRVLITGANGTGKELVARAIHTSSLRAEEPFIEINCAAIPEELIESELFGHIKGSFTGAIDTRKGKVEQADGGTLFLDEIGDMSLRTQAKVLRVIEEQRVEPVGGSQTLKVDVRFIAATNKNLEEEIEKGNFREDLFFRLNVIPLQVPELRSRLEDISLLMEHFLGHFAREYGQHVKKIDAGALEALKAYRWPGNVRELRNVAERLVIMVPGERILRENLPAVIRTDGTGAVAGARRDFESLKQGREHFEKQYILRKLEENAGNITRTAEVLKVERSHLHRKLKGYGIRGSR
jgi:two-component system nitrogen regulation response regulator NtrX